MKKIVAGCLSGLLVLVGFSWVAAQPMGPPDFSPQKLVTVKGTVALVQEQSGAGPGGARHTILMLSLKTDTGMVGVHLGPSAYFKAENISFKEGEVLEVTGAQMTTPTGIMLLASQIKQGDRVLKLRDEQGNPVWQGRRLGQTQ